MKVQAAIIVLISLILTACNQNKPTAQIPIVGEAVDSSAIAGDTLQQKSIEQSYEYAQTVVVNPKLVYDVRAYGGPASHGQYCILRRGADNKSDTVVMAERVGTIVNAFTADLNRNGKEEIYIVLRKTDRFTPSYVAAFEFNESGNPVKLTDGSESTIFAINKSGICDTIYPHDTIFVKSGLLMRMYPRSKYQSGKIDLYNAWKLEGTKAEFVHYD